MKGSYDEAVRFFTESLEISEKALGPEHWHTAHGRSTYAACLIRIGRYEQAEEYLLSAYTVLRSVLGEEHGRTEVAVGRLMDLYTAWGKPEKAAEYRALLLDGGAP